MRPLHCAALTWGTTVDEVIVEKAEKAEKQKPRDVCVGEARIVWAHDAWVLPGGERTAYFERANSVAMYIDRAIKLHRAAAMHSKTTINQGE